MPKQTFTFFKNSPPTGNQKPFFKGIRLKFVVLFSCIILITIGILSSYWYIIFNQKLDTTSRILTQNELISSIQYIQKNQYSVKEIVALLNELAFVTSNSDYKLYFALYNTKGQLIEKSAQFEADQNTIQTLSLSKHDNRIYHSKAFQTQKNRYFFSESTRFTDAFGNDFFLQFTIDPFHHLEAKQFFIDTLLFSLPLLIGLVLFMSIILTRWTLKPLSRLNQTVSSFSLTTGKQLLPISKHNDELDQLSQTLNTLLIKNRKSFETLSTFTANASHELRLPITAMKGEAEICLSKDRSISEYKSVLSSIIEELDKITRMTKQLLQLTRGDSGADATSMQSLDLAKILNKLIHFYAAVAQNKHISLQYQKPDSPQIILGSQSSIEEIFSNLIENALKYTPEKGIITIYFTKTQNDIIISIQDSGIGISPNNSDLIFERFYQVKDPQTNKLNYKEFKGVGLGLSIVKMLVQSLHGQITVDSHLGQGSCFNVSFPKIKKS